mgnify:CR=1 FL=1
MYNEQNNNYRTEGNYSGTTYNTGNDYSSRSSYSTGDSYSTNGSYSSAYQYDDNRTYKYYETPRPKKKKKIEEVIDSLQDATQRNIMRLRYLEGYKWEKICVIMNYSWEGIHKIHRNILEKIK